MFPGAIGVSAPDFFSDGLGPGLLSNVNCSGTETALLACDSIHQKHTCDAAGVVCQGL